MLVGALANLWTWGKVLLPRAGGRGTGREVGGGVVDHEEEAKDGECVGTNEQASKQTNKNKLTFKCLITELGRRASSPPTPSPPPHPSPAV